MKQTTNTAKAHFLTSLLLLSSLLPLACGPSTKAEVTESAKEITYLPEVRFEVIDERFLEVMSDQAKVEILSEGHYWSEGPLWLESEQMVIFSDIPQNKIFSWKEGLGSAVWMENAGGIEGREGSNGLILNEAGQLVLCQHGARQMALMNSSLDNPKSDFTTIVAKYEGKKLNSPNDAVFADNGDLYFTDPPYGLPKQGRDSEKELPYHGVYRLDTSGQLHLLTDQFTRPNGIGLTPDQKTLIVANSDPNAALWKAFDITQDYKLTNERLIFDATDWIGPDMKGLPDGLKVSESGHLFATGPGGLYLFSPNFELLGIVHLGKATANCTLDTNEDYMYLTSSDQLLRIPLK